MQSKQWRLDSAKLAKAYIAGGMTPFQAAQKCGFAKFSAYEDALRELDASEKNAEEMAKLSDTPVQRTSVGPLEQTGEYRNSKFLIKRFAAQNGRPEMIRVFSGGRISFIYFAPEDIPLLQALLREVNREKDRMLVELAELTEERNEEARNLLAELEKNEKAQKRIGELEEQLAERDEQIVLLGKEVSEKQSYIELLQAQIHESPECMKELEALRNLNLRLKDKLVEILLDV